MTQPDNAVEFRGPAIPGRAVGQIGAHERGNLANYIGRDASRDHISDHHVALVVKLLPLIWRKLLTVRRAGCL
jgi:hypothetical protein